MLGYYIALVTESETTYQPHLLTIKNKMFNYIIMTGQSCCLKAKFDRDIKIKRFDTLKGAINYIRAELPTGKDY